MTDFDSDSHLIAEGHDWMKAGHTVGIARVIATWGSAPRPVGSFMIVRDDGLFMGSVSGGCVEGVVLGECEALARGETGPKIMSFGVTADDAFSTGLTCGGTIEISIEQWTIEFIESITQSITNRKQITLSTNLETLITSVTGNGPPASHKTDTHFIHVISPPFRLFIVGAVHVAQSLAPIALSLGYTVMLIDPRCAFATQERFPDVTISHDWPDEALNGAGLDQSSALVTLTHDPKLDDVALEVALKSDAFYIGSLGSRKTQAARKERLAESGYDTTALARIHGPVGLPVGAVSPSEIAVCIMAEITAVRRLGRTIG